MGSALEGDARIPRLAADWERRSRSLSPAEGFLLSRIDGRTPWTLLRQIGGLPPDEVDRCLERWLKEGLLEVAGPAPRASAAGSSAPASDGVDPALEAEIDPALDLPVELQRRILAAEADLERPYHALLGVPRDADTKAIKRAYFALSKVFHPDRYFRQEIGSFGPRLERIFKKIVEAYELLSDPATRAEIERSLGPLAEEPAGAPEPAPAPTEPGAPIKLTRRQMLDRLRRQFRIPKEVLAERKFKARQFYDAARVGAAKERWLEAASSSRLAIAFDPWEPEYKKSFAEIQARVHEVRAKELLDQASAMGSGEAHEALRLLEEALAYRPSDGALNDQAARAALSAGEVEKSREYARIACDFEPGVCSHHVTLARVLRREGDTRGARKALDEAIRLDRTNAEAQEEMRLLRRTRRS